MDRISRCRGGIFRRPVSRRLGSSGATLGQHVSEEKLEKKGLYLRFISETDELDRWLDSHTALLYAGLDKIIAKRDDPGEMSDGFSVDFLFTIKFDDAGNWKIVKTHRMSDKEVENRAKGE